MKVNKLQYKVDYIEDKHKSLKSKYDNLQDENSHLVFPQKLKKLDKYENEENESEKSIFK